MVQKKKTIKRQSSPPKKKLNLTYFGASLITLGVLAILGILNYQEKDIVVKGFTITVPIILMGLGLILIIIDNLSSLIQLVKSIRGK